MTITKIFLLLVCAFVLVLLLSTIFNKYHRIIMWSAAIVFFYRNSAPYRTWDN